MAYRVPKRAIGSGEPADPKLLDENLRPAASELSGRLNEHNLQAASISPSLVPTTTYYVPYYAQAAITEYENTDHEAGPLGWYYSISSSYLKDDGAWHLIEDAHVSFTSGEDLLWIVGWVSMTSLSDQHPAEEEDGDYGTSRVSRPRAQVAIRIDGVVVESTITGTVELVSQPPWGLLPKTPVEDAASIHTFRTAGCAAMTRAEFTVRIQAHVPVQAGEHVVELVGRRIPPEVAPGTEILPGFVTEDFITFIKGRRLLVLDIVHNAAATGTAATVNVADHEEQDVLSAATLLAGGLTPLAVRANDLTDGTIIRHGLRQVHLPSRVLYPCQVGLSSGPAGALSEDIITDGAGTTSLITTNGPYDFETNPAFLVIMANVHVGQGDSEAYFVLRYDDGTVVYDVDNTYYTGGPHPAPIPDYTAGGSGHGSGAKNTDNGTPYTVRANYDTPLFLCLDFRGAPPESPLVSVEVRASADRVLRSNLVFLAFA